MNINKKQPKQSKSRHIFRKLLGLSVLVLIIIIAALIDFGYNEKTRTFIDHSISSIVTPPAPEEKEITQQEVQEYTVAPDKPRYFSLPILGIDKARILPVGLDPNTNEIGTPSGIYDVGWYNKSGLPGANHNVIILDGHNGGPTKNGIFKYLANATVGNTFTIELGNGQILTYKIITNYVIKLDDFNQEAMDKLTARENDQETVAIITCSGRWLQDKQTYSQRTIVKAVLQ